MRISSPRLRRLDAALADLPAESEAMLLSDLDGYLAGIVVCPDRVSPDEWLPLVWSADGGAAPFVDEREAQWYAALVVDHHDKLRQSLDEGRYVPFLEIDARQDEVLWEIWIEGFATAMGLRPESWARVAASGDAEALAALDALMTLVQIARDESDLEREVIDRLTLEAPAMLPQGVARLNAWRLAHGEAPVVAGEAAPAAKVGRNDPCPCGSGRKAKKCCGAA